MRRMRSGLLSFVFLSVTLSAVVQVSAQAPGRMGQQRPPRRDLLEAQVLNRFVNRASMDMGLDATQRQHLIDVVRGSAQRRKALNQRSMQLHRQFAVAIRDLDTQQDAFTKMLADHQALRREEQQIADSEQAELQKFLTPRQQVTFLILWIRLQENARQIQMQIPPDGSGPPGQLP